MSDSGFQMHHRRNFRTRSPLVVALDLFLFATTPLFARSGCIPIHEASQHVGEVKCVTGKVLHVKVGDKGVHFVGFCADQAACPFRVVVFAADLKDVGDVRRLEDRVIEIHGPVKLYNGRTEIILSRIAQLHRWGSPNSASAQELRRREAEPLQRWQTEIQKAEED